MLPIVKEEVGFAIQAELLQGTNNEYVIEQIKRIQRENPCIINFISSFSVKGKDPIASAYCGILVYRLLESQAEADEMKKSFSASA